jgi:hypothetical protein
MSPDEAPDNHKSSLAVVNRDGSRLRSLTKPSADKPRFIDWGTHR